jgi:hypothetical protein
LDASKFSLGVKRQRLKAKALSRFILTAPMLEQAKQQFIYLFMPKGGK